MGYVLPGGVLTDLLNAFLIFIYRIRPFPTTLGIWFIISNAGRIYADGSGTITYRRTVPEYHNLTVGSLGGIPTPVVIVLALWLVTQLVIECTLRGKYVHTIGQNSEAARIVEIRDHLTTFGVLVATSALCIVSGMILFANLRQFAPLAGQSHLMDATTAVLIGTVFNCLGRTNILDTLGSVLSPATIDSGLNLTGLSYLMKDTLVGVVPVVALTLSFQQAHLRQTHR